MSKGVKKGLIVAGAILGVILVLMILLPFLFKGKIKDAVIGIANESLNAEVVIDDFGLNLFSNFPNATLSLNNVAIVGVGEFEADTLLNSKTASVTIDLLSLFGDNYDIKKIDLNNTKVYAKVAENGNANWDIAKVDSTATATTTEEASAFNLSLKNITIKELDIIYEDFASNLKAYLYGWNGSIKGDFSAEETTLITKSVIDELTVVMDGVPMLSKIRATADAKINANFDKMKFTFEDSNFMLNDLSASVDGSFTLVQEDEYEFDLKLKAPQVDFKQVLSLVPAMYSDEFKNIKTAGEVSLNAYAVGTMQSEKDIYPAIDLRLTVSDAMFQYPSLPKSVDNINLILSVNGEGGSLDNLMVLVDKFSFTLGGNPFKGSFRMTPAVNDKSIKFNAEGKLDLAMIKDVYPLGDSTKLNGNLDADIRVATTMSAIEKELYENISAEGHLKLSKFEYKGAGLPLVLINTASLDFTPRYANLTALDMLVGKSDIKATGRLENFIAYALKDKTLKGQLDIKSKFLDLDELMGNSTDATTTETEESGEDIIIPKNINFALNAALTHVVFDKIDITNISGAITVNEGVLAMKNVAASALGGLANINGSYDTSNPKDPKVDFDLGLTRVSFAETFKHIEAVQKFAPIFEDVVGNYSMNFKLNTKLGATTAETLRALTGSGALLTNDLKLEGNKILKGIGSALKTDKLDKLSAKDLNLPFSIKDGALETKPFSVNFGDGGEMMLEGVTRLDQTIDYKGTVKLPKSLDNKFVSKIPLTIGGTFASPKIGVDLKAAVTDAVGNVVGGLLGIKGEDGGSLNLSEEKAKQIEKIRNEADKAATKLVEVAKEQSDAMVKKAGSNKIAQLAAKAGAKKIVEEAEKQAKKLREKAEEQIVKLEGEKEVATEVPATAE